MNLINNTLKHHNLRITKVRVEILSLFQTHKKALTHADLEAKYDKKFDRVTIYRTLSSFLENGLLHKIPDDSGVAKYALCHHEGTAHTHDDHHVHFKCKQCEKIECLHTLEIPKLQLPKKYKMENANLLIDGICATCNE